MTDRLTTKASLGRAKQPRLPISAGPTWTSGRGPVKPITHSLKRLKAFKCLRDGHVYP